MQAKNDNIISSSQHLSNDTEIPSITSTPTIKGKNDYKNIPRSHKTSLSISPSQTPISTSYQHPINTDDIPPPSALPSIQRQNRSSSPQRQDKYKIGQSNQQSNTTVSKKPVYSSNVKIKMPSSLLCRIKASNIKRLFSFLLLIFTIINLAVLIPLAVFYYKKRDVNLTSVAGALSYISFNLVQHPILDVRVQDDGSKCPTGYSGILLGTWPGTTAGCDCPAGLKAGVCQKGGKHPRDLFCDDIGSRKPIDMYDWGGSKWCVLRAKLGTEYKRSAECAEGFRKCSSGICVLETLDCPVTEVKFDTTGDYKLKLGTDRYVVTEKTQGKSPVIDLAITPNNIPCFSEDYFAAGPVKPYILIDANEKGCTKYGLDSKYSFKLDQQKQDKLFYQNRFPSNVLDLPEYPPVYKATDSVLSYRLRMDVAENDFCLNIETGILDKSSKAAEDMNRFMKGTLLAALIIHGILMLIVFIFFCLVKEKNSCSEALGGDDSIVWILPSFIIGFLEFVDFVVMFAATTHFRKKMIDTEDYMVKLAGMKCFLDSQAQAAILDYQIIVDVVARNLFAYSIAMFLVASVCILPTFYLLWRFWKNKGS